ncbi:MAG: hypothetical protein CVU52_01535 [Deltaproteobacteria bacterium HGW-Deltaproteobacteria-10]|nr:MAG: hypothetical protein CVU52_01535 [Deltaproteobacteria bacterium HGW-Deltaproteobacteria-10]
MLAMPMMLRNGEVTEKTSKICFIHLWKKLRQEKGRGFFQAPGAGVSAPGIVLCNGVQPFIIRRIRIFFQTLRITSGRQ